MKLFVFLSVLVIFGYADCLALILNSADISLQQMFFENTGRIIQDAILIIGTLCVMNRYCFRLKPTK